MKVLKRVLKCKFFFALLFFFTIFISIIRIQIVNNKSKYNINEKHFILKVIDVKKKNDIYQVKLLGKEYLICNYKDFPYDIGDIIEVTGELSFIEKNTIPNLFNYQDYYQKQGIYYKIKIKKIKLLKKNKNLYYQIKKWINNRMNKMDNHYLYVFLLGDNSFVDNNLKNSLQENGLMYLLSIGSFEVYLIVGFVNKMSMKCKLLSKNKNIIFIILLIMYFLLTNFKIGVIRSGLCYLLKIFFNKKKIRIKYSDIILLVATLLLLIKPNYLYNSGFYYSFIISYGLSIINHKKKKSLLYYSFFAFIFSIPINIYLNSQINLLSIIVGALLFPIINYLFVPISFIIFIFPNLNNCLNIIFSLFEKLNYLLNNITQFQFVFRKPSLLIIILYYLLIFISIKRKYAFYIFLLLLLFHYNINRIRTETLICFLDVQQGDSVMIKNNDKVILIDTGGIEYFDYSINIKNYLNSLGISMILIIWVVQLI